MTPVPEPAYQDELATVYQADVLEVLRAMPDASVDALVTDPPAGISFMGQSWDTFPTRRRRDGSTFADGRARPAVTGGQEHRPGGRAAFVAWLTEVMAEGCRLLKPGGYALVWAIPRTSHWTATAIEDGGFEVRDVVHHLRGTGFPKSLDVGRAADTWRGWGTALKPAAEHWILARRPLAEGSVARNVLSHGTGALHIDGCRIAHAEPPLRTVRRAGKFAGVVYADDEYSVRMADDNAGPSPAGRWPANVVLSHAEGCRQVGLRVVRSDGHHATGRGRDSAIRTGLRGAPAGEDRLAGAEAVEAWECMEGCPVAELDRQSGGLRSGFMAAGTEREGIGYGGGLGGRVRSDTYGDRGGASRFFYTARASAADRNAGLVGERNQHPTVKPVALMRWLVRLVTPPAGLVLDCFAGSGSTLVAAKLEGFRSIGLEREARWVRVCARRLAWAAHQPALLDELTEADAWTAGETAAGGES